jgi:hypothetical protein
VEDRDKSGLDFFCASHFFVFAFKIGCKVNKKQRIDFYFNYKYDCILKKINAIKRRNAAFRDGKAAFL